MHYTGTFITELEQSVALCGMYGPPVRGPAVSVWSGQVDRHPEVQVRHSIRIGAEP